MHEKDKRNRSERGGHVRDYCNYMVRVEQPTKQIREFKK